MKWIKRILVVLVVLVVLAVVVASFFLGSVIKTSVNTLGPELMGVDVKLDSASVSPLRGKASLKGLVIGNPEGFKTPSAFELGEIYVDLDLKSLASDRIIIRKILIDAPEITFEGSLKGSNISKLMEQIGSASKEEPEEEPAEKPAEKESAEGGKKLQIDEFSLEGAQLNVSMGLMLGKSIPVNMPPIHLEGIGKEKDGASVAQVTREVFAAVTGAILDAVKSSGALLGKGAEKAGELAGQGAEKAGELAGKSAEEAVELVGKGADVAGEAVGKVGDTVGEGAKKLKEGLGGLLKRSE